MPKKKIKAVKGWVVTMPNSKKPIHVCLTKAELLCANDPVSYAIEEKKMVFRRVLITVID